MEKLVHTIWVFNELPHTFRWWATISVFIVCCLYVSPRVFRALIRLFKLFHSLHWQEDSVLHNLGFATFLMAIGGVVYFAKNIGYDGETVRNFALYWFIISIWLPVFVGLYEILTDHKEWFLTKAQRERKTDEVE